MKVEMVNLKHLLKFIYSAALLEILTLTHTAERFPLLSRFSWFITYGKTNPANIYLFKVNNRNNRTNCETCSKLTIRISIMY